MASSHSIRLYNTLTRSIEDFTPLQDNTVRIYSCGPTVYDHAHIGNLSAYIFADTLRRALAALGYGVRHAMNYTDVDDKTIRRSHERYPGKEPLEALRTLTDHYITVFLQDMQQTGNDTTRIKFIRATASETIDGMRDLITHLYNQKFAYLADDGIYFSIQKYRDSGKKYGQLLEITADNTSSARIQNDEYDKESVHDFVLWKRQKQGEPAWPLELGGHDFTGRPGWHIECSVMSRQALGQPFDIHTGGVDLIFPHHENEIAQSTALEAESLMAQFFGHNEHILVNGKKMSKSAQNFYTLGDIIGKGYDPLAFRLLVLQAHYRNQVNFTWESLDAAQNRLKRWRALADLQFQPVNSLGTVDTQTFSDTVFTGQIWESILTDLANDLDTANAITWVDKLADKIQAIPDSPAKVDAFKKLLENLDAVFGLRLTEQSDVPDATKVLLQNRQAAREAKKWDESDRLRDKLTQQGIGVRDTSYGSIWYRL